MHIIIHIYNIKESEATIHTSIEYIGLSPLMFVLATFPKVANKKEKSSDPKSSKNSFPISPNHKINGTHNKRDIQKREIFTKRERQRLREREKIEEFPHTKLANYFVATNLRAKICCRQS